MRLLLARHGATAHNAEARFTGQAEVGLSALGHRQAEALATALAHEPHEPFDALVTSDLRRARETAEPIAQRTGLPIVEDPDLREIALGAWEGRTLDEVADCEPEVWAAWQRGDPGAAPRGGEPVPEFAERVGRALARWQEQLPDGHILWITHGGVIALAVCLALDANLGRRSLIRRDNASLTELVTTARGIVVSRLNDTTHLHALGGERAAERFQVF